jgi:hypothetical protein
VADGGLWLLRSGWALRVVPTPDEYVVGSSAALGARVDIAVDEDVQQRLALSPAAIPLTRRSASRRVGAPRVRGAAEHSGSAVEGQGSSWKRSSPSLAQSGC